MMISQLNFPEQTEQMKMIQYLAIRDNSEFICF
jgi:hypothetical protein